MDPADRVKYIIEDSVLALGFELVRITYGGGRKPTLQIMAERPDGTMSLDDCGLLSREVSALLDVEEPISGGFLLEVSSPGIDRPLTRVKDFERWAGFDIKIEMKPGFDDARRRFKGRLHGFEDGMILLTPFDESEMRHLPIEDFYRAKIILTEELLKMTEKTT